MKRLCRGPTSLKILPYTQGERERERESFKKEGGREERRKRRWKIYVRSSPLCAFLHHPLFSRATPLKYGKGGGVGEAIFDVISRLAWIKPPFSLSLSLYLLLPLKNPEHERKSSNLLPFWSKWKIPGIPLTVFLVHSFVLLYYWPVCL